MVKAEICEAYYLYKECKEKRSLLGRRKRAAKLSMPVLEDVATFRASEKHKHSSWNESWQTVMLLYIMTQQSFWQHLSALNLELEKDTNRCSWICINLNTHALEIKLLCVSWMQKGEDAHFLTCKSNFTKCHWHFSRPGYPEPYTFRFEFFQNILSVDVGECVTDWRVDGHAAES